MDSLRVIDQDRVTLYDPFAVRCPVTKIISLFSAQEIMLDDRTYAAHPNPEAMKPKTVASASEGFLPPKTQKGV